MLSQSVDMQIATYNMFGQDMFTKGRLIIIPYLPALY